MQIRPINYAYAPAFGERLFRTPANFFEQPFNQKGMPKTMRTYLDGDYFERQNMPPAQMMEEIFKPVIELADNLDEVKILLPEEPLFADLTSVPKRKARTGILAEIELMKDEAGVTLFKNGNNDLGMYLLKKIYVEGKTLKEINSDFKKEMSVKYNGISPIGYDTLYAYGIKFPDEAFWKSFTATRSDFPYIRIERKATEKAPVTKPAPVVEKKKETVVMEDHEIQHLVKDMSDLDVDGMKDLLQKEIARTKDETKKKKLSFVAEYLGPIMVFTMDKINFGLELSNYRYELTGERKDIDTSDESEKVFIKKFWKANPAMRARQSSAMKETIRDFQMAYDTDINAPKEKSPKFVALLEEAKQIQEERPYYRDLLKKEREEFALKHDEMQKSYEEFFAMIPIPEETVETAPVEEAPVEAEVMPKSIQGGQRQYKIYIDDEINQVDESQDLNRAYMDKLSGVFGLFPKKFTHTYVKFASEHPLATPQYKFTVFAIENEDIEIEVENLNKILMPEKMRHEITSEINRDFDLKYPAMTNAINLAMAQVYFERRGEVYPDLLLNDFLANLRFVDSYFTGKGFVPENADFDKYFMKNSKPLSNSEKMKLANEFCAFVRNFDGSVFPSGKLSKHANVIEVFKDIFDKKNNSAKDEFKKIIMNSDLIVKNEGKFVLDPNAPVLLRKAKTELLFYQLMSENLSMFSSMLCCADNDVLVRKLEKINPELYARIIQSKLMGNM